MGRRKKRKSAGGLGWKALKGAVAWLFRTVWRGVPVALLGLSAFGIFWGIREHLYHDPTFKLQTLEIRPEGALSPSMTQNLERLYLGENLFKISPGRIAVTIEQDPLIREAKVKRIFPEKVRIELSRRIPSLQLRLDPKGEYLTLAEDFVLLEKADERNRSLALVEAFEVGGLRTVLGRKVLVPGLEETKELIEAFGGHPLGQSEVIDRLRVDHLGNVSIVLADGPELRFGRHPMQRFPALDTVTPFLKGADRAKILYLDLQFQDLIVRKR